MDFLELTKQRYSVRKFSEQKVESEKLNLILKQAVMHQLLLIINHNEF